MIGSNRQDGKRCSAPGNRAGRRWRRSRHGKHRASFEENALACMLNKLAALFTFTAPEDSIQLTMLYRVASIVHGNKH